MSPVPADPFPDLIPGALADPNQLDARFLELYRALNPALVGLDDSNIAAVANIAASKLKAITFSAKRTSVSAVTGASGIVVYDTEEWDDSGWHDPTTGRFTPQIPGRYWLAWYGQSSVALGVDEYFTLGLRKNGAEHRRGNVVEGNAGGWVPGAGGAALVTANGTTDYFDVQLNFTHTPPDVVAISGYFQGALVGRS